MTVDDARHEGYEQLQGVTDSPQLDADLLLAHVLDWPRVKLYADADKPMPDDFVRRYRVLLDRRRREPVAYLTGHKEWFGLDLIVSPAVLVPRPETELVAERAIAVARIIDARRIVDVGTGSGALAIALARALPEAYVIAIDVSADALAVASRNVDRHVPSGNVHLIEGDLLAPLVEPPDLVVANLPYLGEDDVSALTHGVRREPVAALVGGRTGLEVFDRLFAQSAERGWWPSFILEIDCRQAEKLTEMAKRYVPAVRVTVEQDLAGLDRIMIIEGRG